jgi:hypothetical protein
VPQPRARGQQFDPLALEHLHGRLVAERVALHAAEPRALRQQAVAMIAPLRHRAGVGGSSCGP